ncbi:MAG TPA: alpha-L-arabinofuranosidase C-terminal domain-containing protein [Opitutaceae bacterium]|nr:alpha-L-arabinofuranosidase C-terminal domain-containing protein [Opitutaceae bacterium]
MIKHPFICSLVCAALLTPAALSAASIKIEADRPGAAINPAMWGVFFEDINFGADGGLYAELIKNRSFEFPEGLMGWNVPGIDAGTTKVSVETANADKTSKTPGTHFLKLESSSRRGSIENEGFRGIGVVAGDRYDFKIKGRGVSGTALRVEIVEPSGLVIGTARVVGLGDAWSEKTATLVAQQTEQHAHLRLVLEGAGSAEIDWVSLFPQKTWKQRPGGLRADMVQSLADLGPGFLRFPGGCIVEGSQLSLRYQWKKTLGPVEERPLLFNRWNTEIKNRPTPDYFQSFGLGFYEYFVLCEDLGAEPLPILNCGMACQFNSGELAPLDKLDPFIQDALDLIEFANGAVTTTWGAKRAALGHPAPFNLKMMGVGNEQWGPQYIERFAPFAKAIKAKYPDFKLVGAAGPSPDDERFHFLWPKLKELKADIIDEHCYAKPEWFFDNAHRYDNYDRNGPKVFMGEYAAQSVETVSQDNKNTWRCALSEAAYMTGLERNADVVRMASYAPLFAHVDAWQWTPDLIWTNNLQTLRTPSYHVQRLFARNRGDRVLPVAVSDATPDEQKRLYVTSSIDEATQELIVKIVNATDKESKNEIELSGVAAAHLADGTLTILRDNNLEAVNSFDQPNRVAPRESTFAVNGPKFSLDIPSNSFVVLRVGMLK